LLYSQTTLDDYNHFTPERRQVLSKMGEFFDETIRKSFPAEIDTLSYLKYVDCIAPLGPFNYVVLDIDRNKLKEINQLLFKDQNYYFIYARYIYMGQKIPLDYKAPIDSIPTLRGFALRKPTYEPLPILNYEGYIKVVPDDVPAIELMKEEVRLANGMSLTIFMCNLMGVNVREVSNPVVKELCAVVFWRYICWCAGIDLVNRKPFCEPCDLSMKNINEASEMFLDTYFERS